MSRTSERLAAQREPISPAPIDQGNGPQRSQQQILPETESPRYCTTPGERGAKRALDGLDQGADPPQKRPRPSHGPLVTEDIRDPISFWARQGRWPQEFFDPEMQRLLARKRSPSLARKRSISALSTTPSDQKPREEKSAPYRDQRYETLLETKGSFLVKSDLDVADVSKILCQTLLDTQQTYPQDSLFRDDVFESAYQKLQNRNDARVIQDIARLIVPSAESLAIFGAKHLNILTESVNEGWNNSIALVGTRPQPDYSVGFKREAFTAEQLEKLSPFIGDFITGDQSFFMATYYMYFPFLSCEVKCAAAALLVADRQNAHSMTLAARAVVELFRLVKREEEVHRQILAFSVSHDDCVVRIYGCYPVIDGEDTKYYRHPVNKFDFTALNGKDRWTAYRFIRNLYDLWMPQHFKRICSAIDQLPAKLDFGVPSLTEQELSESNVASSSLPVEDEQSGKADAPRTASDNPLSGEGGAGAKRSRQERQSEQ